MNTDYKLIEKCIAKRMVPALEYIINEDQKGFLPNRRIACNIRKILDVVTELREADEVGIVLSCDYLKCFDRIEQEAVFQSMQIFSFSETLINWIKILYTQFSVKIQNNGNFSRPVHIERSVRQGGPASNALFLVVAELLAIKIRNNEAIEGITLRTVLHLLNQYADDMDVCSKYKQSSLDQILEEIKTFGKHTGFQLSYEKTSLYRVGSMKKSVAELYMAEGIKWTDEGVNILGVEVCAEDEQLIEKNYQQVIEKTETTLNSWKKRRLSLLGKVNIVNTLVSSLFVYKMTVLPRMPNKYINILEQKIEAFLWSGHKPKIPLRVLQCEKDCGGAGLVDFRRKDTSLKTSWIKIIFEGGYSAELVHNILQEDLKGYIWSANLAEDDVDHVCNSNNGFWKNVLKAWCRYHYCKEAQLTDQFLWWNSNIRINNQPIFWKVPFRRGLKFVTDLVQDGVFLTNPQATQKFGLSSMQYNALKSAIPATYRQYAKEDQDSVFVDPKFKSFMAADKCV